MTRTTVVAALGAIALGAGFVDAQEPPALEAPLEAAVDSPSGSPPDPPPAERPRPVEPPSSRPLLVIPGVTAPPSRRTAQKPAAEPAPSLDAPIVPPDVQLRLESIPGDEPTAARPSRPRPSDGPSSRSTSAAAAKAGETHAARGPSTFGRLLGPATGSGARDDLSIESSGDPAVEAAVKRRVEKQIADALGGRVTDVKVRVSGRSVAIHARATRLWYRWSARRTLDALPMPPGYRGRAVVE